MPEREQALRELLRVEADRLTRLPSGSDLILAGRSVHTLLAHSYALEQMTGIGVFEPSVRLLRASPLAAWPELVMYLDLPQQAVEGRNNGKSRLAASTPTPASTQPSVHISCGSPPRTLRVWRGSMRRWTCPNWRGWPRRSYGRW